MLFPFKQKIFKITHSVSAFNLNTFQNNNMSREQVQTKHMNAVIEKDEAINLIRIVLRLFDYMAYLSHRSYYFYFIKYFPLGQRQQTNCRNNS